MKCIILFGSALAALAALTLAAIPAQAAVVDDTSLASPGVYFGSGNGGTNQGWTVDTEGSVEVGLTTIQRSVGSVLPTTGNVYNVQTGADPTNSARAWWNFDLSVNLGSGGLTLGDVTPMLTITDIGKGTSTSFDPFLAFGDNSAIAANGTTRNGNTPGQQATVADIGMQNSENIVFFSALGSNFNINDTFLISLALTGANNTNLGAVDMSVIVGSGAVSSTPLPAALPLFAGGLGVVGLLARRKKRKAASALAA